MEDLAGDDLLDLKVWKGCLCGRLRKGDGLILGQARLDGSQNEGGRKEEAASYSRPIGMLYRGSSSR